MTKRYQQKQEEAEPSTSYDTPLPLHLPAANYYRQSTMAQVGNLSTEIQTVDMTSYITGLGWEEENIIMIDMDAGVSGTKRIDEREGMSELFRLITNDEIGAVACQDEDRLFRDVTQIQVNIFIEACKQHKVLVITPSMIYNFFHEQMGPHHARQFRFKSEMAAEYINSFVIGKLHRSKQRLAMSGRWSGASIPTGYMIDDRKHLPNGIPNEQWRKLEIFEAYAEVIREYWRLFLSFGGHIRTTAQHILEHGPYYPDPAECKPPEGYRVHYRIRQHHGKWCASRNGLRAMLTNAMYLGHWMINGNIVIWDNHPAIIDEETFRQAFNYLSKVNIDGSPNTEWSPNRVNARNSKDSNRPESRPLYAGLVSFQDIDGNWLVAGTIWFNHYQYYRYLGWSKYADKVLWGKKACYIDEKVSEFLLQRLNATFDFDQWEEVLDTYPNKFEQQRQLKQAQLDQLNIVMDNLISSLSSLKNPQMIAEVEKRYEDAQLECNRLKQELEDHTRELAYIERIHSLKDSCEEVLQNWSYMKIEEKRQIVHLLINTIEVKRVDDYGLQICVRWKDGSADEAILPHQSILGDFWLTAEKKKLVELMHGENDQREVARHFPNRTWRAIMRQYVEYSRTIGEYKPRRFKRYFDISETYNDYLNGLTETETAGVDASINMTQDGDSVNSNSTFENGQEEKPSDITSDISSKASDKSPCSGYDRKEENGKMPSGPTSDTSSGVDYHFCSQCPQMSAPVPQRSDVLPPLQSGCSQRSDQYLGTTPTCPP